MAYTKRRYRKKAVKAAAPKKTPYLQASNIPIPFTNRKLNFSLMKRAITDIVDADKECKRKLISQTVTALHHGHINRNILGNIIQGTSTLNRESEEIKLCAFKGKFMLRALWTVGATYETYIRIMFIRTKVEASAGVDTYSSAIGSADLYLNNQSSLNLVNSQIDPKKVQLLFDKTVKLPFVNSTANTNASAIVEFNVPLNHDYVYKTGSNNGNKYNYQIVMVAHSPGGTAGTTQLVYVEEDSQVVFKDK